MSSGASNGQAANVSKDVSPDSVNIEQRSATLQPQHQNQNKPIPGLQVKLFL